MMETVGTLVRRGTQMHGVLTTQFGDNKTEIKFPNWAVAVLILIAVISTVTLSLVQYTYGHLIPTLIMVEDPDAAKYDPLNTSDPILDLNNKIPSGQPVEPEILTKPRPITYNFRTTLAHLRARGGRFSRFRGLVSFTVANIVIGHISRFIGFINVLPFRLFLAPVLATTIGSHFLLLWTHIVITEPSQKRWYRRFAPFQTWKKIAGPTAVSMAVQQLASVVPFMIFLNVAGDIPNTPAEWTNMSCRDKSMLMFKGLGASVLSFILWFLLIVPAKVSLTRVQASLLSQEEEPIVPFDRSFGGKVIPTIVGGSGVLGLRDAWKTFNWNSRVRLFKAYIKVAAIEFALIFLFTGVAMATAVVALGPENLKKFVDGIKTGDENMRVTRA